MMHPHLWEMLAIAQNRGCRTSFTTNASMLDESQVNRLLDSGVNLVSISFAGADQGVHQSQRLSSNWDTLVTNVARLAELKLQRGCKTPWLEMHFLMTRDNFVQLPDFVELAARLGADEVVATNLTYAPTRDIDQRRVFGDRIPESHAEILAQAKAKANKYDLPARIYPLEMEKLVMMCDSRPDETVFINHLGEVTPCVYLGLSLHGEIPRFFQGESHPISPVSFGNVRNGLPGCLSSPARKEFNRYFQRRISAHSPLANFAFDYGSPMELPPPPPACRYCYKMYAV
jgi:MoaA/NifB/PqqE/SkfB family radical SAM enzyme